MAPRAAHPGAGPELPPLDPALVPEGGHSGFDLEYGLTLGDDAIPELVAALDALPPADRNVALAALYDRRSRLGEDPDAAGPQSWNPARIAAREALAKLPPE